MSASCQQQNQGIRSHLRAVASAPPELPVACHGSAQLHRRSLQSLLQAAGAKLALEQGPELNHGPGPESGQDSANRPASQTHQAHGFAVDSTRVPSLQALAHSGARLVAVNGLCGVLGGLAPRFSAIIANLPEHADEDAVLDCARVASHGGCEWPTVAVVDQPAWQNTLVTGDLSLIVQSTGSREAMSTLFQDAPDMLLMPEALGPAFTAAALALSGTGQLAVETRGTDGVLHFSHEAAPGEIVEPAALVMAAVRLLLALGQYQAAEKLHNSVLATLEDGLFCGALNLLNPYTRILESDALFEAMMERLDTIPRRVKPACYGPRRAGGDAIPHLKVIG